MMPMPTIQEEFVRDDDFNANEKFPIINHEKYQSSLTKLNYNKFIEEQLFFKPWN